MLINSKISIKSSANGNTIDEEENNKKKTGLKNYSSDELHTVCY